LAGVVVLGPQRRKNVSAKNMLKFALRHRIITPEVHKKIIEIINKQGEAFPEINIGRRLELETKLLDASKGDNKAIDGFTRTIKVKSIKLPDRIYNLWLAINNIARLPGSPQDRPKFNPKIILVWAILLEILLGEEKK